MQFIEDMSAEDEAKARQAIHEALAEEMGVSADV